MLHLEGENYLIRGESIDFANRQKSIFDQLDAVKVAKSEVEPVGKPKPKKLKTDSGMAHPFDATEDNAVISLSHKGKHVETKHFKGKESIFKRPEIPPPNRFRQTIPDFQRNPHKWKKYTLCDVSQDDMSEKSNTAAAMAFLNEIRLRKEREFEEPMETDKKITFKQPSRPKVTTGACVVQISNEDSPGEDGTSYFRGSKLVMPEYVVGKEDKKKQAKQNKVKKDESAVNKEIKLNHLTEFDDEEEEDNID
ncbi:uncharacterized protein LOC142325985 [Lycorma delicatula]|uniref:uncharacterized protein LOC142325985 n=1 Tax=Lycorma delicatula TaxID=130591 RepID=UPI003F5115B0